MANIVLPFVTTFNDKGVKQGQASLGALAKSSLAGAVSVGVVVDQLGKAVKAAAEDQKAQELLELAVRNNTSANTDQIAEMEKTIGKMEMQKAVADDQLRPALGNLVRATGDVEKAQSLLNLALDISSATGRDLQSVTVALSRAQMGSMTALTRLGIPLNAAAVKSKDLEAIQADLALRFAGAADAAANSADGGMKKLQIALDNTYEAVGYRLLPIMSDYVTVIGDLAEKALDAENSNSKFGDVFGRLARHLLPAIDGWNLINKAVGNYAETIRGATSATDDFDRINRLQNMYMSKATVVIKDNEKAERAATDAKKKARQAAKEYADTLRGRVETSLGLVNDKLKEAQDEFDGVRDSMASTFMGFASLSDAFKTNSDAITAEQEALKARSEAYTALDLAKQGEDTEAIAKATLDLAEAEKAVNAATALRSKTTTLGEFQKQIAAAKKFGENLQFLIGHGLQQAGLAQLLNLGPVAGVEVTNDMISGSGGSFWEFQNSMAALSGVASSIGLASANAFMGGNLATATTNQQAVNQYSITVNAGLVSNPAQVGRDIIEAIKNAERVSGQVFVSV
jgi:hypothetical protein